MNDMPSKVVEAIQVALGTRRLVIQNIALAFGVKGIIIVMGAMGMVSMWGAVFADVGVALIALFNSVTLLNRSLSQHKHTKKLKKNQ